MKIEREFANTVGGVNPGGSGYSDVLAVSVPIGPGTRKSFAREQEKAKKADRCLTTSNPKFTSCPFTQTNEVLRII